MPTHLSKLLRTIDKDYFFGVVFMPSTIFNSRKSGAWEIHNL